jgi:RNA polymerase sigma factor for flagellar operon FliA
MKDTAPQNRDETREDRTLWQLFAQSRDPRTRARLVQRHLEFAKRIAASLYAHRADDTVEFEDYLQYARVGLIEAVDRYDPEREASFGTYATYRVRGAVLNGVEKSTEKAAQRVHRHRFWRERVESLRAEPASPRKRDLFEEVADAAIALALGYVLEDSGLWRAENADRGTDPYRSFELKRLGERFALIVEALPERERAIVKFHYFDHMEFNVIAAAMGISRGRVSQLHSRALQLLRESYQSLGNLDVSI